MKVFFSSLVACLVCMNTLSAIPSSLGQSVREYKAILDSPLLFDAITPNEFIFDLERKTEDLKAKTVHYIITTHHNVAKSQTQCKSLQYRVTLKLEPNPQIGPLIINVVEIKPIQ